MYRIFTLALATGLSLGLWSCGTNNGTSSENTTSTNIVEGDTDVEVEQEATSPADLVLLSAMSTRLQNNLSELAETKASSTEIQELGKELKQQSSEVLVKIENLMEATDVNNVPQALSVPQQATYDQRQCALRHRFCPSIHIHHAARHQGEYQQSGRFGRYCRQ